MIRVSGIKIIDTCSISTVKHLLGEGLVDIPVNCRESHAAETENRSVDAEFVDVFFKHKYDSILCRNARSITTGGNTKVLSETGTTPCDYDNDTISGGNRQVNAPVIYCKKLYNPVKIL
jgi:hypothetical protein